MADLIDPRQRLAACVLLCSLDLPASIAEVAKAWMQAAEVCPGVKIDQLPSTRREGLERAAALIAECLADG